jgi:integrase
VGLSFRKPEDPSGEGQLLEALYHIKPRLKTIHLDWVNCQAMRRTHSSLMRQLEVDPKIVADQLGHSVDVNLNVNSKTSLRIRKQALDSMESAVLEA